MSTLDMEKILEELSKKRDSFYSEADFQFSLGWEIMKNLNSESSIFFEIPISQDGKERVDILVRTNGLSIPIELKYFHSEFEMEGISLKKHNDTWRSYKYIKDIERIENYLLNHNDSVSKEGYAILISNEQKYWRETRANINYYNFRLTNNRVIEAGEKLDWQNRNRVAQNYGEPITLKHRYEFVWKDYSFRENMERNKEFKYLLSKIEE